MKKKECPSCAMEVPADSKRCPVCDYEFTQPNSALKWIAVVLALFFLLSLILF